MREGFPTSADMRPIVSVCVCVAFLAMSAIGGLAHGGPPLRLGVTADPAVSAVSAVARLVLVHLREGVGFAVDWREFPDEGALQAAFAAGKIDIAVVMAAAGQPRTPELDECSRETLTKLGEILGRRWGGEAFLLGFPVGTPPCDRPALIVARAVLEDLRFGILGKEAGRLAAFITREDVAVVRAAAGSGGERAATAAARTALAGKAKR